MQIPLKKILKTGLKIFGKITTKNMDKNFLIQLN